MVFEEGDIEDEVGMDADRFIKSRTADALSDSQSHLSVYYTPSELSEASPARCNEPQVSPYASPVFPTITARPDLELASIHCVLSSTTAHETAL